MVHLCLVDRALVDITTQQKRIRGGSGGNPPKLERWRGTKVSPDVPLHTLHRPLIGFVVPLPISAAKPFHRVVFSRITNTEKQAVRGPPGTVEVHVS